MSLDGERFFYTNPLGSRGHHHRQPWYECACCPPNVLRVLASVGNYLYAATDGAVYVNLYAESHTGLNVPGVGQVTLHQQTSYPWDGRVRLAVDADPSAQFSLYLRIPEWCRRASVSVDGRTVDSLELDRGYARVACRGGTVVALDLPMPIERVTAHPHVRANLGRVALQRGPIVYCLEQADNPDGVRRLALPREAMLSAEHRTDLLGGVTILRGEALAAVGATDGRTPLYSHADEVTRVPFTAIPYYAWDNRGPGEMVVWLPESVLLAERPLPDWIKPSASHCYRADTLTALIDGQEPAGSDDHSLPRFTWWPRKGSSEWVQLDFTTPRRVSGVEVYWFDDRARGGGCGVPTSWKLLYLDGEQWLKVPGASDYGVRVDTFNAVIFTPVMTPGLRIEAQLAPDTSAGILEWRIETRE